MNVRVYIIIIAYNQSDADEPDACYPHHVMYVVILRIEVPPVTSIILGNSAVHQVEGYQSPNFRNPTTGNSYHGVVNNKPIIYSSSINNSRSIIAASSSMTARRLV